MSRSSSWWAGWFTAAGVFSLIHDISGPEKMTRIAQEHWVSGWITVPLALVGVVVGLVVKLRGEDEDGQ